MASKRKSAALRDHWQALPRWQRTATVALAAAEIVATAVAAADLARRPRDDVRGPKSLWWPVLTVQPFGPFAYLKLGRRKRP